MRGDSQFGFAQVKDQNGVTIRKDLNKRWAEHFENVLSQDTFARKDIEENENLCDTLDVKEDLFCEEELVTVIKGLKNNKAPGADSVVNELFFFNMVVMKLKISY